MSGQDVATTTEIPLFDCGALLSDAIITPDEAIVAAHVVSGYATSAIESVALVHDAASGQWYWGMVMDSGVTISVKAGFASPCN